MQALALQALGEYLCAKNNFFATDFVRSPGSLIAGTWAAMQYMGSEYVLSILILIM